MRHYVKMPHLFAHFFYFFIMALFIHVLAPTGFAGETGQPYKKQLIFNSRFGEKQRQELLKKAYRLQGAVAQVVVGQDRVAKAMQDRLVQYLENLGTRTKDPVALHLIGLPGIGKSAMLDELGKIGIPVIRVDAQAFVGENSRSSVSNLLSNLRSALYQQERTGGPLIILFDELDKIPEINEGASGAITEKTNPLIGLLNQALTDGKMSDDSFGRDLLNLSNAMIVTSMNFSPKEIEMYSSEVLGGSKSFYDFTIEDFARFDEWMRRTPSARSKVLSRLFRSNTVSRLVPNTLIVKPLDEADYRRIIRMNVENAIKTSTTGANAGKRIEVVFSEKYVDFLYKRTVYAPSGARDTVMKANAITEQLISFGAKARGGSDVSLAQPRSISLDCDESGDRVRITMAAKVRKGKEAGVGDIFSFPVEYDDDSRAFIQPVALVTDPEGIKIGIRKQARQEKPITKKEIRAARFPKQGKELKGLAKKIDEKLIGQEEYTRLMERELTSFLGRPGPVAKNPPFLVIAGFPGIGKSELVNLSAEYAGLHIARVNMQAFSGTEAATLSNFIAALEDVIDEARIKSRGKNGKFIMLFEELDKVFEINPQTGAFVDRPVMNFIKDLLNDGYVRYTYRSLNGGQVSTSIDVRDAYNIVTMNFAVDRFSFEADPRLTTIEDVNRAWQHLKSRPADLKKVLGSMFLPETVSRIMPRFSIMKPLDRADYEQVIAIQAEQVIKNRLFDKKTGKNKGQVSIRLTPEYKRYLYQESVIPSEGARNTVLTSQQRIAMDLEEALKSIPRASRISAIPLTIELDYRPGSSTVVARAEPSDASEDIEPSVIYQRKVALTFPPLGIRGRIPKQRLLVAVHEFGHAFNGIRLGRRFEYATVVPPKAGVGGYVKFVRESQTAKSLLAEIYSLLGSRAMERVFLSDDPLSAESVLDISSGAASDIQKATEKLWKLIYEFGFDPNGGTIERKGVEGVVRYAHFSDLEAEEVSILGVMLRDMENYVVADFLKAHSREWYAERIKGFARAGGMTESAFYEMIAYPFPGQNRIEYGDPSNLDKIFKGAIEGMQPELRAAMEFKQGETATTAAENLEASRDFLASILKSRLHGSASQVLQGKGCEDLLIVAPATGSPRMAVEGQ